MDFVTEVYKFRQPSDHVLSKPTHMKEHYTALESLVSVDPELSCIDIGKAHWFTFMKVSSIQQAILASFSGLLVLVVQGNGALDDTRAVTVFEVFGYIHIYVPKIGGVPGLGILGIVGIRNEPLIPIQAEAGVNCPIFRVLSDYLLR